MKHAFCSFFVFVAVLIAGMGCSPSSSVTEGGKDGDHNKTPASYAEAMAEIREHAEEIRLAFEAGNPGEAHDALHEIGKLLNRLPDAAAKTQLSAKDRTEVEQAASSVFDQYHALDKVLHGGKETKYADVAEKIDEGLKVLEDKLAATVEGDSRNDAHGDRAHADED